MSEAKEEGVTYVSLWGSWTIGSEITAADILDALANAYVQEQLEKTSSKIFNGMYSLSVKDADGEELEDVTDRVRSMIEAPAVALWSRMKQAWADEKAWGPCIVYPKWQRAGGEVVLQEIRRLPPESFSNSHLTTNEAVSSELLPGIVLNNKDQLEFWQTQSATTLEPVKLREGVTMLKDASSTKLAGSSLLAYLVPIVRMINFCWDGQMQKINRVASPIFFIRITGPGKPDDVAYAQTILKNWGKSTSFQLRSNMEVVELDLTDNEAALNTIAKLEERIAAPFRNTTLDKDGSAIGGNAAAQKEGDDDWIQGERTKIEDQFEALLQPYLDLNAYEGCTIEIKIAVKRSVPGDLELRQAQLGVQSKTLSPNEVRQRLGAEELDDDKLAKIAEQWALIKSSSPEPATDPAFGDLPLDQVKDRAEILSLIGNIDELDPEKFMDLKEQITFLGRSGRAGQ